MVARVALGLIHIRMTILRNVLTVSSNVFLVNLVPRAPCRSLPRPALVATEVEEGAVGAVGGATYRRTMPMVATAVMEDPEGGVADMLESTRFIWKIERILASSTPLEKTECLDRMHPPKCQAVGHRITRVV